MLPASSLCSPESRDHASQTFRSLDHVLRVDAALFHNFRTRRTQSEFVQADHFAIKTDVLIPNLAHAGFDCDASAAFVRQDFFAIFFRLAIESFKTRHGNDANAVAELSRR